MTGRAFGRAGADPARRELEVRGMDRLPWQVADRHRGNLHLEMLTLQLRAWDDAVVDRLERRRLSTWRRYLRDLNAVVVYDPTAPDGFALEPRQVGDGILTRPPIVGEGEIR